MTLLQESLAGKPIKSCPIIDIHVHLGVWPVMPFSVHDDGFIGKMELFGVDRICINGILHPIAATGNDLVADFVLRYPNHAIGFASLNPLQGDMVEELKRCIDMGFQGIKLHEWVTLRGQRHGVADPRLFREEKWERIWTLAAEHKLPILFHGLVSEEDIKNHPETIFIGAHAVCMTKGETIKRRFAQYPNYYIDTCLSQNTYWEYAESLEIYGAERIIWGSDAPIDDFAQRIGIVLDSPASEEEKRLIIGGNAMRLLGISSI